jgi:hypothetical protein
MTQEYREVIAKAYKAYKPLEPMILFLEAKAKEDNISLEKSLYKDMLELLNNYEQAKMYAEDYAEEERLNHFYLFPEYQGNEKYRE